MLAVSSILFVGTSLAASWDYDEPEKNMTTDDWPSVNEECGYNRQSPIDVIFDTDSSCSTPLELNWPEEGSDLSGHFAIRNSGHTLVAIPFEITYAGGGDLSGLEILHHNNDTQITLKNNFYNTYESEVNKRYCFHSLHFHWADNDDEGSEHTYNGQAYPLEVHFVHFSCDYKTLGAAATSYASGAAEANFDDENVLAVIGVVFEIGEENPALAAMLDDIIIDGILSPHGDDDHDENWIELYYTEFDMADMIPDNKEYTAYLGSLTTPPCFETVRWHNMKTPMTVSEEQMAAFRSLLESSNANDTMSPNFRPVMPLNDRTIYECQEEVDAASNFEKAYDILVDEEITAVEDSSDKDDKISMLTTISVVFGVLFGVTCLLSSFLCFRLYGTKM